MRRRDVLVGLGGFALAACHRGSPTEPSGSDSGQQSLTVLAGRDDAPVAGASVSLTDGQVLATDGRGQITLPRGAVGTPVSITAARFTGPRVVVPSGVDHLLPDDEWMPGWWVKEALYASNDFNWLWRPMPGVMSLLVPHEVLDDPFLAGLFNEGVELINDAQTHVAFRVPGPGQTVQRAVQFILDPSINAYATTLISAQGATTVGATIRFVDWVLPFDRRFGNHFRRAVAHELAHVAGLTGHPQALTAYYPSGMMWGNDPPPDFAPQEKAILNMIYMRPPGTRPPDNSTNVPVASASTGTRQIPICEIRL